MKKLSIKSTTEQLKPYILSSLGTSKGVIRTVDLEITMKELAKEQNMEEYRRLNRRVVTDEIFSCVHSGTVVIAFREKPKSVKIYYINK